MMRFWTIRSKVGSSALLAAAMASCAPIEATDEAEPPPNPMKTPEDCGAAAAQDYVGQVGDEAARSELEAMAVGGFRWIPPGTAVTQDFRPDRLNIELDRNGVIVRIDCY